MYDNIQNRTNETIQAYRTEVSSLNWESRRLLLVLWWRRLQLEARRLNDMHGTGPWVTIALLISLSIAGSIVTSVFSADGKLALLFFSLLFGAVFGAGFCVCLGSIFNATNVAEQAYALQFQRITDLHHRRAIVLGQLSRPIEVERARMERERAERFAEEKAEQSRVWDCLSRDRCPECNVKYIYYHSRVDGGPDRRYNYNPLVCQKCDEYRSRRIDEFERDERMMLRNYRAPFRNQWPGIWTMAIVVGFIVLTPVIIVLVFSKTLFSSNTSTTADANNSQNARKVDSEFAKHAVENKQSDQNLHPELVPKPNPDQGSISEPIPKMSNPTTTVKPKPELKKPTDPTPTPVEPVKPKSMVTANATVTGTKAMPIVMGKLAAMLDEYREAFAFNSTKAKKMISDGDIVLVTDMLSVFVESRARGYAYLRPTEGDSEAGPTRINMPAFTEFSAF